MIGPFGRRSRIVWSTPHTMDVSYWVALQNLDGFVRNKMKPEGSMTEGYALEEALGFCTKYLQDFVTTT